VTSTQTVLAFDYGVKRLGVAVGQTLTRTATALEILPTNNSSLLWSALDRLIKEWQPDLFVLGKPLHADDSETPLFEVIKDFGNQLQARYNRQVQYIDERLSSNAAANLVAAENGLQSGRGQRSAAKSANSRTSSKRKAGNQHIDHVAAKLILESWFSETLYNKTEQ